MELELIRAYFPSGTNGVLYHNKERVCDSIELPWLHNKNKVSCVPEGRYELNKRYSEKFGWHLILLNVPGREYILIHGANDAMKELSGCIAPVSLLTAEGKGLRSQLALRKLKGLVFPVLARNERVFLTIKAEVE